MTSERQRHIEDLYHAALECKPEVREAFLQDACGGDPDLRREVESLLTKGAGQRFRPGSMLGSYEILSMLGKGGMGEVYRADDPRLRREVAIKVLSPDAARDPDRQRRFEREARAASALNHPNILTVYEIGRQDESPYIVMELVDGQSLREHLRKGPLPARKFLDIATQLADGLAAAHQAHITHRDLKPENIMLTRDGRVKILDFGLALHALPPIAASDTTLSMAQTRPGALLGTLHYMSPEQASGMEVDYRSDQFSFGVILYEMAAGAQPFHRPSAAGTLQAILSEDPPAIPERAPVSIPVRWIIARLLSKDPAERYTSTADLYRDLRAHRDHALSGILEPVRPQSRRRWIRYAFVTLLVIIAAVLGARLMRPALGMADYRYTPFALDAGMDAAPAWSPDGKTIAYLHDIDGVAQVLTRGVEASVPTQLTKTSVPCTLLFWAPDGNRIFYISGAKLWSVSAAGGNPQLILDDVNLAAAISPDGQRLAFGKSGAGGKLWLHSLADGKTSPYPAPLEGQSQNRQVRFSPDGKKIGALWPSQREHTLDNTFWILPNPPGPQVRSITLDASSFSWMPDSRHLVAAKNSPNAAGQHLYWVDTETGKSEALTSGLGSETLADVSPDGSRIAFTSGGVDTDLIEVPLDNSPIRTLLSTSRNETNPSWSPDGSQFAYVQDSVGRGTEIWLRSVNGAWSRPLIRSTSAAVTFTNPRFSPDGQRILYESWSSEGYLLWITTVGGGNPVRVTPERNHQHAPAWSPDGNWVAYRANVGDERLIEKVPSGGGHPVTLARTATAFFVVWSPNGEWLCYVDFQSIHLVAADGSQHRKLVDRASNAFGFSRDGRKLYFVAPEGSKSALWSIEIASSKIRLERMLDTSAAAMRGFSLHPDGKRFATSVAVSHEDIWILDGFERPGGLFISRLFRSRTP